MTINKQNSDIKKDNDIISNKFNNEVENLQNELMMLEQQIAD